MDVNKRIGGYFIYGLYSWYGTFDRANGIAKRKQRMYYQTMRENGKIELYPIFIWLLFWISRISFLFLRRLRYIHGILGLIKLENVSIVTNGKFLFGKQANFVHVN